MTINNQPPSTDLMTCMTCGHVGVSNEYHPYTFCVLYKAGQDPWQTVREAAEAAGWLDENDGTVTYPSRESSDA